MVSTTIEKKWLWLSAITSSECWVWTMKNLTKKKTPALTGAKEILF